MNYKRLPQPFQRRVRQYYEYLWLVDGAAANGIRADGSFDLVA